MIPEAEWQAVAARNLANEAARQAKLYLRENGGLEDFQVNRAPLELMLRRIYDQAKAAELSAADSS